MAPKVILDESEAGWANDFRNATLARMSLYELIYHVLARDESPFQRVGESPIDSLARQHNGDRRHASRREGEARRPLSSLGGARCLC
jgi:hypothetical protein